MGKKDNFGHTGPASVEALDKQNRKRLEKLQAEWDKSSEAFLQERLSLRDLRLLLEYHAPLQALIRAIASSPQGGLPLATDLGSQAEGAPCQAPSAIEEHAAALSEAEHWREQCQALQQDLKQCSAATNNLLKEKSAIQQELEQKGKTTAAGRSRSVYRPC